MSKAIAAAGGAAFGKKLGIGGAAWLLLTVHLPGITEATAWVELAGRVVALIAGLVVLFKHKGDWKPLLDYFTDIVKKTGTKVLLLAGFLSLIGCSAIKRSIRPQLYIYGNVQIDSICVAGDSCGIFKK